MFQLRPVKSSHRRCSIKKDVIRNFAKLIGKHLCHSLFLKKVAGWSTTLLKKWLRHRYFSINFPELFIMGKYVKIGFKNRGPSCYFLSCRGQKSKNITKIKQKRLFLFTFLVSYFTAFLVQKLIYTINIWFNFVFGSFFEQDHLLNLFILGVYAKRWPKCARISIQKLM